MVNVNSFLFYFQIVRNIPLQIFLIFSAVDVKTLFFFGPSCFLSTNPADVFHVCQAPSVSSLLRVHRRSFEHSSQVSSQILMFFNLVSDQTKSLLLALFISNS